MERRCQVGIIGGGPAGATAAFFLARGGVDTVVVEKEAFPRYSVGESLLPYNMPIFRAMGLEERLRAEGFQRKDGAVFGEATSERLMRIRFGDGLEEGFDHAYQVPRDRFDQVLLEAAGEAGAEVCRGTVSQVLEDGERILGFAGVDPSGEPVRVTCDLVLDCSGRQGFLGRKLDLFEPGPELDTAAAFGLFGGVGFPEDAEPGDIIILAYDRGWFWFIPFADGRTSVGTVVDRELLDGLGGRSAEKGLRSLVDRAGGRVATLMESAESLDGCRLLSRFNRRATRFAGPGWVLVGDAAMFVDPVFSAGVLVATVEAKLAADTILDAREAAGWPRPEDFTAYARVIDDAYELFCRYIFGWRDPVFREVFCHPDPAPDIRRTVTTILAGGVFDRGLVDRGDRIFHALVERRRLELAEAG